ncbi:MAG: metallophosphatase family protein [Odoribacter sp.]|nr:metallophosphatase family protein [Odoribacter sp.]
MKIGVLSDTHGWLDKKIINFFKECEEVWHCGDIGNIEVIKELEKTFKVRAVYGNIDGGMLRQVFPETAIFVCEGMKVLMTHIGGYPGKYVPAIRQEIIQEKPGLFLSGHSHITKVMYDKKLQCLHINPGAAGRYGFHKVRTVVRFEIQNGVIKDLELAEYPKNS